MCLLGCIIRAFICGNCESCPLFCSIKAVLGRKALVSVKSCAAVVQ